MNDSGQVWRSIRFFVFLILAISLVGVVFFAAH
jgi:hypothetical protein